jgi:hypothetical protein
MKDTSILDAINAGRRQRRARRKYYVGASVVFVAVIAVGIASVHPKKAPNQTASLIATSTQPHTPTYQYAYLQKTCNDDMNKYNSVIQQVTAETNKIGQLIKEPDWADNTANLIAAQGVLTTNENVLNDVSSSEQILQGCLNDIAAKQSFTQAEISDINSITSSVPIASTQSTTVAGVILPTYSYTPPTLQTTPTDYSTSSTSTTPTVSTTVIPPSTTSTATSTAPTCNEQLKADDTAEYKANQNSLDSQENAAISSEEAKLGQEGLSGSGIGQQQITSIQQSYNQQNQELTSEYQQELTSIDC